MAKLTKAEKLLQEQMLALLEWASDRPKSWHPIGTLAETQRAAELLAARGVIEIRIVTPSTGGPHERLSKSEHWGAGPQRLGACCTAFRPILLT